MAAGKSAILREAVGIVVIVVTFILESIRKNAKYCASLAVESAMVKTLRTM